MTGSRRTTYLVWLIALALSCSAAPLNEGNHIAANDEVDEDVKALHGLDKEISVAKSVSEIAVVVNGERAAQSIVKEDVHHNGQQVAHLENDKIKLPHQAAREFLKIDIPSEKIHKSLEIPAAKHDNGLEKRNLDEESWDSKDTPRDMAEYIFWTGDEASVTTAIRDFLKQGLLTQTEAIGFLEEVRYHLHQMQQRYRPALQDANEEKGIEKNSDELIEQIAALNKPNEQSQRASEDEKQPIEQQKSPNKANVHQGQIIVQTFLPKNPNPTAPADEKVETNYSNDNARSKPEKNDNMLEKMQLTANYLSREYGLEEVIYQLARALFAQAGNKAEAEESMQKLAGFLDEEARKGHITPELQKKVLDVLLASLVDTVGAEKLSTKSVPVMMKH